MTIITELQRLPWQLLATAAAAAVLLALLAWYMARRVAQAVRELTRRPNGDILFSQVTMIVALGWSADSMWIIARDKAHLPLPVTIVLFTVFEAALLLSMARAKKHLNEHGWPGKPGTTAWGIAGVMSVAALGASTSMAEALVRMVIPLIVTKLWWDGLVSGTARRAGSAISWRWTPRRLLLWVGAIEPGERDVETVHRERLAQTMTRLEYGRRHGSKRLASRRAARLARLSLKADDALIEEVRQRVDRATWFTVTRLTQASTHPLTQLTDARLTRQKGAPAAPVARVITSATSGDAAISDPATQAAHLVMTRQADSIREAARQVPGASEATVRRRLDAMGWDRAAQPVTRVNGNHPDAEVVAAAQL